jgi:hypothetical protein
MPLSVLLPELAPPSLLLEVSPAPPAPGPPEPAVPWLFGVHPAQKRESIT